VDTQSWNVFDSETYVADLSQAATWDATGATPNWHLEYSARQAYGAHKNNDAFQQFWTYRSKSANRGPACPAGGACPKEIVCNLRAGKSSDACTAIHFSVKRSDEEDDPQAKADAADPTGRHSLYKRSEPQPWNKKLCGLTANL
ncbi:hypothetical protein BGZ70_002688, partial [Mortierella alpina]